MEISRSKYLLQVRLTEYLFLEKRQSADAAIAFCLLDRMDQFPELYLDEIAARSHTTPATVSKFLRKIGFESFGGMKTDSLILDFSSVWPMIPPKENLESMMMAFLETRYEIEKAVCRWILRQNLSQVAEEIWQTRKVWMLCGIHSIASVNYFAELCARLDVQVLPVNRDADACLLQSALFHGAPVFIISLSGQWIQKQAGLFAKPGYRRQLKRCVLISEDFPERAERFRQVLCLRTLQQEEVIASFSTGSTYLISNFITDTALHLLFTVLALRLRELSMGSARFQDHTHCVPESI